MSVKDQAKDKGSKVGLVGVAMVLISYGQQAINNDQRKVGAALLVAGAALLLGYEYLNDKSLKGSSI